MVLGLGGYVMEFVFKILEDVILVMFLSSNSYL